MPVSALRVQHYNNVLRGGNDLRTCVAQMHQEAEQVSALLCARPLTHTHTRGRTCMQKIEAEQRRRRNSTTTTTTTAATITQQVATAHGYARLPHNASDLLSLLRDEYKRRDWTRLGDIARAYSKEDTLPLMSCLVSMQQSFRAILNTSIG